VGREHDKVSSEIDSRWIAFRRVLDRITLDIERRERVREEHLKVEYIYELKEEMSICRS
jgi:hypothetical protein